MKTLLILGLISVLLIAGCTQSNTVNPSAVVLTKSEIESVGFTVTDWKSGGGGMDTRENIAKIGESISSAEKRAGYTLPLYGYLSQSNIMDENYSVRVIDMIKIFDTEDNAKAYYSNFIRIQNANAKYSKNNTRISDFNFGDEGSAVSSQSSIFNTTDYVSAFRKGRVVVEITVNSRVDAKDGFIELAKIIENKL